MKKDLSEKNKEDLYSFIFDNISELNMKRDVSDNFIENNEQEIILNKENNNKLFNEIQSTLGDNKSIKYKDYNSISFKFQDSNEVFNMNEENKNNKIRIKKEKDDEIIIDIKIDEDELYTSEEFERTSEQFDILHDVEQEEFRRDSEKDIDFI